MEESHKVTRAYVYINTVDEEFYAVNHVMLEGSNGEEDLISDFDQSYGTRQQIIMEISQVIGVEENLVECVLL